MRQDKEEYLGCLEELEQLIRENNLDQIYIIQKHGEELPFTQQYVDICIDMGVTVRLVVDFYKRRRAYSYVSTVGTYPVITYHTISLNTYEMAIKRLMGYYWWYGWGSFYFSPDYAGDGGCHQLVSGTCDLQTDQGGAERQKF